MKSWLIILLIFACAMLMYKINNTSPNHTEGTVSTEAYYYYTVGNDIKGYVDGQETRTFELYQRAVCVKEDGLPGMDTASATCFFNQQRDIGLGIKK